MYRQSQRTRGHDIHSQTMVSLVAVWHQVGSLISLGEGGLISAATLEAARLASDFAPVGDISKSGAGDAVELRDDRVVFLVGDGSPAGKSPWGCERVDTILRAGAAVGKPRERGSVVLFGGVGTRRGEDSRKCNVLL